VATDILANDSLLKPFSDTALLNAVNDALGIH
jgi:hypothetical protein